MYIVIALVAYFDSVSNGRKQAGEALKLAEITKSKLLDIFAKEKIAFDETQKRLAAEAEMERAKQEMWALENERRALECETSTIDTQGFLPKETSTPVDNNLNPPPAYEDPDPKSSTFGLPQVPDRSTKPRSSSTSSTTNMTGINYIFEFAEIRGSSLTESY